MTQLKSSPLQVFLLILGVGIAIFAGVFLIMFFELPKAVGYGVSGGLMGTIAVLAKKRGGGGSAGGTGGSTGGGKSGETSGWTDGEPGAKI